MAAPKTAVLLLCLVAVSFFFACFAKAEYMSRVESTFSPSFLVGRYPKQVPTAIIAQTDIAVDAVCHKALGPIQRVDVCSAFVLSMLDSDLLGVQDKHCSQPKPAPLPEKLKETKPAPTGPGSPPPVSADVTGEGFGNICGIASLPKVKRDDHQSWRIHGEVDDEDGNRYLSTWFRQAICVLEKAGPCCEKKGGCKDEITVSGPIKLDKKATVNGKAVTPFEVDENFDTTFKVATPKGFKSEIRVYLTSSVSFSCPVTVFFLFFSRGAGVC